MNGCGNSWYYRVTKESNMEYIGRKSSGKGQIVRVGSGFQSKRNWPELPDFVPDLSLPIGRPQFDREPYFLFEQAFERAFGSGSLRGPDVQNQSLWSHPWVMPHLRYNTRDSGILVRNVDYFVNQICQDIIPYVNSQMQSIGRSDFEYSIRNFTWGYPPGFPPDLNGTPDGPNTFLFMNRPEERPSILNGLNYGMWSKNGIDNNRDWDTEFWTKLKLGLANIGYKDPYFCNFNIESTGLDFYPGSAVYPISGTHAQFDCANQFGVNDIGYISCCLQDSRSSDSDFLVDGQRTFQQFWSQANHRDGGSWPCLDFATDGYVRTPKAFEGFWRAGVLYSTSRDYCIWKACCEPALQHFPNMVFSNAQQSLYTKYHKTTRIGVQNTSLRAMNGYAVFDDMPTLTNWMQSASMYCFDQSDFSLYVSEDLNNFYNQGFSAIDPRLSTFRNYMTYDFSNYYPADFSDWNWFRMQHMRRGLYNGVVSGGTDNPMCPWFSAWTFRNDGSVQSSVPSPYNSTNTNTVQFRKVWVETIKYAISIGIRNFGVWEGAWDAPTTSFWSDVLIEVKDWYDNVFKKQISIYT